MTTQNASQELINYLITQANSGNKIWFGFLQQKIAGIDVAYKIAVNHADKMTPEQIAEYVLRLNNAIYTRLVKGE